MSSNGPDDSRKKRKRPPDQSEQPPNFLPRHNPSARVAYVCVILGLIPVLGVVMGLPALVYGILGRRKARRDEKADGLGHSVVSIYLGLAEIIFNGLGIWLIGRHYGWWNG